MKRFTPACPALLRACLVAFAGAVTHSSPGADHKEPITHEALWLMKQVGAPAPSPDGRWVIVPVTEPAYDEKDEVSDLWMVPGDGSAPPRRLTTAKGKESSPAWSPDGTRVAFSAKREGDEVAQLYLLALAGGEARRITELTLGAREPRWSPDGSRIAFLGPVSRGATNEAANKQLAEDRKKAKSKVRIYDGFPIRRWDKWLDDTQTHLFVMPADGSGPPRDWLAGSRLAAGAGFRGVGEEGSIDTLQPEWAPDGRSLVFTATTNFDHAAYDQPVFSLYQVSLDDAEPRRLTPLDASFANPTFASDGKHLAFTANAGIAKVFYAIDRPVVAAWPWDGMIRPVAPDFDRSAGSLAFSADSKTLYVTAEDAGHVRIWSVPAAGGRPEMAVDAPEGVWLSARVPERGEAPWLFANWEAAHRPAETFRVDLRTGQRTRLTSFNVERAEKIDWPALQESWAEHHQRKLHSFLALPPAFDAAKKYPLLVLIHGGHASMWRDSITRRWNYHLLAQPGYVVLLTDYVGSTGYGEAFTQAIQGDPLRGPAADLNAAADAAVQRFSFIDGGRQAAAGASYGGHLANWLEASTTRYRCLISHAGLVSLYAQWATSDSIYHRELMMRGPFWEKPDAWLENSPATYAARFRTPMLLSVGENDHRVPMNNTLEMWSLLQRQQVPSRLLVWPDENHWISKGENSRVFYREVHAWLEKWLKN